MTPDTWLPICTVVTAERVPVAVTVMMIVPRSAFSVRYCGVLDPAPLQARDPIRRRTKLERLNLKKTPFQYDDHSATVEGKLVGHMPLAVGRLYVSPLTANGEPPTSLLLPRPMALSTKDPPPAAAAPRPAQPRANDGQPGFDGTFFGPKASIEGTVTGSEPVIIEGQVKGTINLTGELRIGMQARVEAKVHARNVIIEGKVNGDISADDRVELVASASVDGNIKAPKIIVAEGARFRGNVDMGSAKPTTTEALVKRGIAGLFGYPVATELRDDTA